MCRPVARSRAACLVTGGAGFLGSHLVRALVRRGHAVTVLDNFSSGSLENLREVKKAVRVVRGDVREPKDVRRALRGAEWVFHLAALVSVPGSIKRPGETYATNAEGTRLLLEESLRAEVLRVVYASSCAVYGDGLPRAIPEDTPPRPQTPYALSKWMAECYARAYWAMYGLEVVVLRFFNVYGPGQSASSPYSAVVARFSDALVRGRRPFIYGDGRQTRDFVYVGDTVDAFRRAAGRRRAEGRIINIGSGRAVSIRTLFETLARFADGAVRPRCAKARRGDIRRSRASVKAARSVLGFRSRVTLREGLRKTYAWFAEAAAKT
ncbi:MAG: NAD-dependent epimerase/dehydratase family protein [Acidobacteriota bacterium]|nr:MAG: NAD-dependent epimerase/dehydratase family protein [Acidobacteriota bacterium]